MKITSYICHIIFIVLLNLQVIESYQLIVVVDRFLIHNINQEDWANFKTVISNLDVSLFEVDCMGSQFSLISKICQTAQNPGVSGVVSTTCYQISQVLDDISTNLGIIHVKIPFNVKEPKNENPEIYSSGILETDNAWLDSLEQMVRNFKLTNLVFISDDYAISTESYAKFHNRIQDVLNTSLHFRLPRNDEHQQEMIRFIFYQIDNSAQKHKSVVLLVNNHNLEEFFRNPSSTFSYRKVKWIVMSPFAHREDILSIEGVSNVDVVTNTIRQYDMTSNGYLKRDSEISSISKSVEGFQSVQLIQLMAVIEKFTVNFTFLRRLEIVQNASCFDTNRGGKILPTEKQKRILQDLKLHLEKVTPPLELFRGQKVYQGFIQTLNWKRLGYFNSGKSQNNSATAGWSFGASDLGDKDEENSLEGKVLRVVTVEEEPFIMKRENPDTGEVIFEGYCIDVLEAVQQKLDQDGESFKYIIYSVQDGQYGVYLESEQRWTGLVGDILREKADIAVAGMIRNYDRETVVDFVASHMDYGVGILIRKPKHTNNFMGFMEPLAARVWICICLAGFVTALGMYLLIRFSPLKRRSSSKDEVSLTFANAIWFVISSFLQQGCDTHPPTIGSRILISFWYFFALIIVATYTANLAAFLTVTRMDSKIQSLSDLASQDEILYGTVDKSSLQQFFKDHATIDTTYEKILNGMETSQSYVSSITEGYSRVIVGRYAFMWDEPVLEYHRKRNCDLVTVGKAFNKKNYAFAVPKNSPYGTSISLAILKLQESGELEKMRQKWFEAETMCPEEENYDNKEAVGLEMKNMSGVFLVLIIGLVLSITSAVIENLWFRGMEAKRRLSRFIRNEVFVNKAATASTGA